MEYTGVMRAQDLHAHATFNAANPVWQGFDCVSVIHAGVDVSAISLTNLDGVFTAPRPMPESASSPPGTASQWLPHNAEAAALASGQGFIELARSTQASPP